MAAIRGHRPEVVVRSTFTVDDRELGALAFLAHLGDENLVAALRDKWHGLDKDDEAGLRSLLDAVRRNSGPVLTAARDARALLAQLA